MNSISKIIVKIKLKPMNMNKCKSGMSNISAIARMLFSLIIRLYDLNVVIAANKENELMVKQIYD